MRTRTALPGLLAVVMAVSGAAVPSATANPVVTPGLAPATATVTLLTGDTVIVSGTRIVNVRPAAGREHVIFHSYTDERGDMNVVPADAEAGIAAGTLDPRLFNVTGLVEAGYDDASAERLPLIVDYAGPTPRSAAAQVSRELPAAGATAVAVERSAAYWPTARKAERVWLDGRVQASLEHSVPQIGAPAAWSAGHTGAGTTVAVLDTGIDTTHPDLAGAVVGAQDFSGGENPEDRNGHGTHVASIVTGEHDRYRGVAPDTRLLNGKVLGDDGVGYESTVMAGMEWAATQGADVINLSLAGGLSDGTDPLSRAVNELTARTGALFVIAAGNSPGYVATPGTADAALTVGAVDRDNELWADSGRGPRYLDHAIKPDITAPGVDIVAARAANSVWGEPGQSHMPLTGTSMATPHVAGAAAILAGVHPDWTADQLKAALMGSAAPKDGLTPFEQGAGRVDVAAAVESTVVAAPASLSLGEVLWPHGDNELIKKTLTYTNLGAGPVTLDLTAEVRSEDGSPAPRDMVTFAPASLTVPAGGSATTTVTVDTTFDGPVGVFQGVVTATPDTGDAVRTPIAVAREIESYDVNLSGIDHEGAPSDYYRYRFVSLTEPAIYKNNATGPVTVRLPAGEYTYTHYVGDPKSERVAEFVEPTFTVSRNTELVLDARETVPVDITVDDPTARNPYSQIEYRRTTQWGEGYTAASSFAPNGDFSLLTLKPSATSHDGFTMTAQTIKAKWNGESFDNSPYLYHLKHTDNRIPEKPRWHNRTRDLAKVSSEHATTTPGSVGVRELGVTIPLPGTLTEYFTPGVKWDLLYFSERLNGEYSHEVVQRAPLVFSRGKTTTMRWNVGVLGPRVNDARTGSASCFRAGDMMYIFVSPVSDQGPGRWGGMRYPGKTKLLRDGELVGETEWATYGEGMVAPERAVYTLQSTVDRSAVAGLSTRIDTEWTFTSERTNQPDQQVELPLLGVRYAPQLDDHNAAPRGKRFTIPVTVERNGSDSPGQVNAPTIEVSYDDGGTWQSAKVKRHRGQWAVTVDHPADADFVSLRSAVSDPDGNAQRLTIIRAYALKKK